MLPAAPAGRRPLAGTHEQIQLSPLDHFLEDAKAGLLLRVENLIHGVVRAPQIRGRAVVEVA